MEKNKRLITIIISSIVVVLIILLGYIFYRGYRIKHALKVVKLSTKEVEVYEKVKLKDLIKSINGELIDNPKVDTTKLGKRKIHFEYITDKGIKVPYTVEINVVDKTPPLISQMNTFSVDVGYDGNIEKELFCGDNYDDNPKCSI